MLDINQLIIIIFSIISLINFVILIIRIIRKKNINQKPNAFTLISERIIPYMFMAVLLIWTAVSISNDGVKPDIDNILEQNINLSKIFTNAVLFTTAVIGAIWIFFKRFSKIDNYKYKIKPLILLSLLVLFHIFIFGSIVWNNIQVLILFI